MLQDIEEHLRQCAIYQSSPLPAPTTAPPQNVPVGHPREMVAVDILQVPLSYRNNRYLLVIQDYFTKWAEAIPLLDQTVDRITKELTKVFTTFGVPDILHSNQGGNFESAILRQTFDAFGVTKCRPRHIIHKGTAWLNASTVHSYKCYEHMSRKRLTWNAFSLLSCRFTVRWYIHQQALPPSSSCLGVHCRNLSSTQTMPMTLAVTMTNYRPNWL